MALKGWYGNKQAHSLASKGIRTKNTWKNSQAYEDGLVGEVPIDWLWQFRNKKRGEMPPNWDDLKVREKYEGRELEAKNERENIERIKKDILENGLISPLHLVVGKDDERVSLEEGNHRLVALKELGYEKVPIIVYISEFTFSGIEYFTDVQKTKYFPSRANPINVFPDLKGYTPEPRLQKRDWKEEYR